MSELKTVPFEPGQPVVLGAGPVHARRWYRTVVRQIDNAVIWLDGAPEDQPMLAVTQGEDVTCQTWRYMDALYNAEARISGAKQGPNPLVGLTVERAERTQRREYLRVPLAADAEGTYLGRRARSKDDPALVEPVPLQMTVADLSAGGLRGRSTIPMQPGDELTLALPLPRSESSVAPSVNVRGRVVDLPDLPPPLNLRARVVRLCEPVARGVTYEVGVAFIDVAREDHERIIRFAMEVQRDRRRRGMI